MTQFVFLFRMNICKLRTQHDLDLVHSVNNQNFLFIFRLSSTRNRSVFCDGLVLFMKY